MAGTMIASVIKNDTTSPPAFQNSAGTEIGTLCRAWVNFNGNTPAARASFNVSSITSLGTGHYRVNFTNALADTNYAVVATCCFNTTSATTGNDFMQASNFTTSTFDCASKITTNGVIENVAQIGVAVFR